MSKAFLVGKGGGRGYFLRFFACLLSLSFFISPLQAFALHWPYHEDRINANAQVQVSAFDSTGAFKPSYSPLPAHAGLIGDLFAPFKTSFIELVTVLRQSLSPPVPPPQRTKKAAPLQVLTPPKPVSVLPVPQVRSSIVSRGEFAALQRVVDDLRAKQTAEKVTERIEVTKVIEPVTEITKVVVIENGLTEKVIDAKLSILNNELRKILFGIRDGQSSSGAATLNAIALTNKIDQLHKVTLTDAIIAGSFSGLTDAHIPDDIVVSKYVLKGGDTLTGTLVTAGAINASSTLGVTGTSYFMGNVAIASTTSGTPLGVQGRITSLDLFTGNIIATGTLEIRGNTTLASATTTNFAITGTGTTTSRGSFEGTIFSAITSVIAPFFKATSTTATSTFGGGFESSSLSITSSTASSTFANGLRLSAGCFLLADNTCASGGGGTINTGTANRVTYYSDTNKLSSFDLLTVDPTNNRFGVGTTTPSSLLSIHGNALISGTSFFGGAITGTSTLNITGLTTLGNASTTQIGSTGSAYFATASGNVGIGTTSPSAKLTVNGSVLLSGANTVDIENAGKAGVRLKDTAGVGYWDLAAIDFFNQGGYGVHNHTLALHYNEDGALAGHPKWGENWEPSYVPGAPPNGLFEKNWDYTSIDRSVSYRPFNFNVNLNDHQADMRWLVGRYSLIGRTASIPTLDVRTDQTSVEVQGKLTVQPATSAGAGAYRFVVTGPPIGTVLAGFTASGMVAGDILLFGSLGTVTGDADAMNITGSLTGLLETQYRNTGTGGTRTKLWAGSSGDAWTYLLANQEWAYGVDRSDDGKFKISNSDLLGVNDRVTITATGNVGIGTTTPGTLLSVNGRITSLDLFTTNIIATGTLEVRGASSLAGLTLSGVLRGNNTGTSSFDGGISSTVISAGTSIIAPFFKATSTTATSTFAGGFETTRIGGTTGTSTLAGLVISAGGFTIKTLNAANCDLKADTSGNITCGLDVDTDTNTSGFTDSGSTVALTTFTDNLGIGTSSPDVRSVMTVAATSTTANILTLRTPGTINGSLYSGNTFVIQDIASSTLFSIDGLGRINGFVSSASSTIDGTLMVAGNLAASSTLRVTGATKLYSTLDILGGGLTTLSGGFVSQASSSVTGGLIVSGAPIQASSTVILVGGTGTSTFAGGIQSTVLNITSTTATSTFANGLRLSGGCFLLADNTCASGGGATINTGTANRVTYYSDTKALSSFNHLTVDATNNRFGIASSTPTYAFSVGGDAAFDSQNIYFASSSAAASVLAFGRTATITVPAMVNAFSIATSISASNPIFSIDAATGYVGIGTAGPGTALHVTNGSLSVGTIPGADFLVTDGGIAANSHIVLRGVSATQAERAVIFASQNGTRQGAIGSQWYTTNLGLEFITNGTIKGGIDASGNVGIGTSTPSTILSVHGNALIAGTTTVQGLIATSTIYTSLGGLSTTNGVCHSGANLDASAVGDLRQLVACSGAPADIAEFYETKAGVEEGDIVMVTDETFTYSADESNAHTGEIDGSVQRTVTVLDKAVRGSGTIMGIISTDPYQTFGRDVIKSGAQHAQPVSLVGRVPVKVNGEQGAIRTGDRITLSSIPGVGRKAKSGDTSVGVALEPFSGSTGSILVFVNLEYARLDAEITTLAHGGDLSKAFTLENGTTHFSSDLNLNQHSLLHVGAIFDAADLWHIDAAGNIKVNDLEVRGRAHFKNDVEIGTSDRPQGITIFDRATGAPHCVFMKSGLLQTEAGACGVALEEPAPQAIIPQPSAPVETVVQEEDVPAEEAEESTTQENSAGNSADDNETEEPAADS